MEQVTPSTAESTGLGGMAPIVLDDRSDEEVKKMLNVNAERVGEMAVIECEGRIVRSDAAFKLREAVNAQKDSRMIVIDLSEVSSIDGGGLGMLMFLQRWARDHEIRLKLFNPRQAVWDRLTQANSMRGFEVATPDEMIAMLAHVDVPQRRVA